MKDFNEKCAEYLGWKKEQHKEYDKFKGTVEYTFYVTPNQAYHKEEDLWFNRDWNWIMKVLEAILEECSENGDLAPYYDILDSIPDLEKTKQAIYNYITDND